MTVGYVRHKTIGLVFDGDMADLEVTMRVMSIDTWLEMCELSVGGLAFLPGNRARLDRYRELLLDHAVSWSLETPDGEPVPFTLDEFRAQDKDFQAAIMDAWTQQAVSISAPLDDESTDGPALDAIPMTPPSASQAS